MAETLFGFHLYIDIMEFWYTAASTQGMG